MGIVMGSIRTHFVMVESEFLKGYSKVVGIHGLGVYNMLKLHADSTGRCYPPVALMAERLGVGQKQVKNGIKALERYGIITVYRHRGSNNSYKIISSDKWPDVGYVRKAPVLRVAWDSEWPVGHPAIEFQDKPLTCEFGHNWHGEICTYCGLLQEEEEYKMVVWHGSK